MAELMQKELKTRIVLRHDTAAKWNEINPTLKEGELGIETDTGLMKVGNGLGTWTTLDYINKFDSVSAASHYDVEPTGNQTDVEAIAAKLAEQGVEAKSDDIAIVRREIANEKYSHTAYVYNGTLSAWTAMDGNYNADNIYFDKDFLVTEDIGAIKLGDNYSTTLSASGKNLNEVFTSVFAARKMPEVTQPSVSIKFVNSGKSVEAGSTVEPEYQCTFNPGTYSYDESTGVTANSYTVTDNRGNSFIGEAEKVPAVVIGDQKDAEGNDISTYKADVVVSHSAGNNPHDNYGDEQPSLAIAANDKLAGKMTASAGFSCYRNYFYGALTTTSAEEPLTSDVIRTYLTAGGAYKSATNEDGLTVQAGALGAKRVVVAYPKNTTRGGLKRVTLPSSMNMEVFNSDDVEHSVYKQILDVDVEGADGYTAIPYTVFVYEPTLLGSDEIHNIWLA